jgi:KUP system potassium uptake protein
MRARTARLLPLALATLGIVYGDIGTSPLYTMKEIFFGAHALARSPQSVLGALSLVFWTLGIVVTVKYVLVILRTDQNGEGGIFALLGLLRARDATGDGKRRGMGALTTLILIGAALLYGDGVITPSISVLSAVEGLEVATLALKPAVIPVTVLTLVALFWFQSRGTARVGRVFGPIMVGWFVIIAAAGLPWIVRHPEVAAAVNPVYGVRFLIAEGWHSAFVLGGVVLCITGGEALYADLGHFGRKAIRTSWFSLVYPSLLLNYFGQGARLLDPAPIARGHVFYAIFPQTDWIFYPVVALSTVATVIASQALISGAFSLTRQAIALGLFPRLRLVFTSAEVEGQIYMPGVNAALLAGCVLLVLGFETSNALAAAYGIAVTGTMSITTLAFYHVARAQGWKRRTLLPLCSLLIGVDLTYFAANSWKFFDGGYVPIVIALGLFAVMKTWQWGRGVLAGAYLDFARIPMRHYVELKQALMASPRLRIKYGRREVAQVERAVVFLSSRPIRSADEPCPVGLRVFTRRHGALPKHVILLNVAQLSQPYVPAAERRTVTPLGANIVTVNARYGYMQTPDIPALLRELRQEGLIKINESRWTVQIGEEEIILDRALPAIRRLATQFFRIILRAATPADRYFGLRDYPGRSKIVVPVIVSRDGARVAIPDEET